MVSEETKQELILAKKKLEDEDNEKKPEEGDNEKKPKKSKKKRNKKGKKTWCSMYHGKKDEQTNYCSLEILQNKE